MRRQPKPSLPDGLDAVQRSNLEFSESWTRSLGEVEGVPVLAASVYELVQLLNGAHMQEMKDEAGREKDDLAGTA